MHCSGLIDLPGLTHRSPPSDVFTEDPAIRGPSFFVDQPDVEKVFRAHFERDDSSAKLSSMFRVYYRLRPIIPVSIRRLLQRWRKISVADDWYKPIEFIEQLQMAIERADAPVETLYPWPDRSTSAVVLTHDVEARAGFDNIIRVADLEQSLGFRSVWNLVPNKYAIDPSVVAELLDRGFEIGIHGDCHDGKLFWSREEFTKRSARINRALAEYEADGFRAPLMHRKLSWIDDLHVDYDASCFDIDPFQSMPGGVGGIWPFIYGSFVELPYTLPQDHTLFVALKENSPRIWLDKLDFVRQHNGMVLLLTHPDYLIEQKHLDVYRWFLEHLRDQEGDWRVLPAAVARWWRDRSATKWHRTATGEVTLDGPAADRADVVTWSVESGELQFCF